MLFLLELLSPETLCCRLQLLNMGLATSFLVDRLQSIRSSTRYYPTTDSNAGYVQDRHGCVATKGDEGYYYKWYQGIHMLCGEEGLDKYKRRPSHEDTLDNTWYFVLGFKCVHQDNERGEDESEDVEDIIGSSVLAATGNALPTTSITNSTINTPRKKSKLILHPPIKPKQLSKSLV